MEFRRRREAACNGKRRHRTEQIAKWAARLTGPGLCVYVCPYCTSYHVGHVDGWRHARLGVAAFKARRAEMGLISRGYIDQQVGVTAAVLARRAA